MTGRSHNGTAAGLPFDKFSQVRLSHKGKATRLPHKGMATRLTPQGGGDTEARLPHMGDGGLTARQPSGVFKLVDEIFTGIFPHIEIIAH